MAISDACLKILANARPELQNNPSALRELAEEINNLKPRKGERRSDLAKKFLEQKSIDAELQSVRKQLRSANQRVLENSILEELALNTKKSLLDSFADFLEGTFGIFKGARNSVDLEIKTQVQQTLARIMSDIKSAGFSEDFTSGLIDKELSLELFNFNQGKNFVVQDSGNEAAKTIAEIINNGRDVLLGELKSLGVDIHPLGGFVTTTIHKSERLLVAGKVQWVKDAKKFFSVETFQFINDIDRFLGEAFDRLSQGKHEIALGIEDDLLLGFRSKADLGKRVAASRFFKFKDSDALVEYNTLYGTGEGNLVASILTDMNKLARNTALIRRLGTSPQRTVDNISKKLEIQDSPKIQAIMDNITGKVNIPGNVSIANFGKVVRTIQNASKLGLSAVSSLTDIMFQARRLNSVGVSFPKALFSGIKPFLRIGREERIRVASNIEVFDKILTGQVFERFGSIDNFSGNLTKVNDLIFKANLLSPLTESQRQASMYSLSNHLAEIGSLEFNSLPKGLQLDFLQADISENLWNKIRTTVVEMEGVKLINLDALNLKDQFTIRKYFIDLADAASPLPGVQERRTLRGSLRAGTGLGELVLSLGQFKTFALTVLNKPLARDFKRGDYKGIAQLMAGLTIGTFATTGIKDVLRNRTPQELTPQTFVNAFINSGAGALPTDIFAAWVDASDSNRDSVSSLAGPAFGEFKDTGKLIEALYRGDKKALAVAKFARSHIPNLFYTQAIVDFYFWNNIFDWLEPGFTRRRLRRLRRRTGQEPIVRP